ncbi:subtilisin-like protease SBT3.4 isoform X2 [Solanum pennellii]|uniref:Subtilisin-like protease SBT3.4 isoform X2 n=1 Tax=Solanum pennellii TaxID=28526 RepID=A0ABM1V6V4_SOLPN|nr:subtilisin-like protease SBT3.4 isoform X2 [Solanum pennellii]
MSISYFLEYKLAFTALLLFLNLSDLLVSQANAESKVHIVYMGRRQHDDVELATSAHHQLLTSVLGSQKAARDSIIYSYKHGFSGFAARLTKSQAKKIAELPDVVHVVPNHFFKLHTTRSWDYLGLSESSPPTNLLHEANMGDGIIIGVLDTGIWPESEAFNDKGLGPIPSRWKGHCQSGDKFDPATACNRKLIGAKYYLKGFEAEAGRPAIKDPDFLRFDIASPRDRDGHGTHTSSTAGGSFTPNASYHGLGYGTVKGGAPKARIAMYKVCWNWLIGGCTFADTMMAIDEAIHDGVDILSISLGLEIPLYADIDMRNGIAFASFHAVIKGITVICSGGNEGPYPQTVVNISPWILTVAASSIDRSFPTLITLGNNQTFSETGFIGIAHPEISELEDTRFCNNLNTNDTWAAGKVVLCFIVKGDELYLPFTQQVVQEVGGLGLIVAKNPTRDLNDLTFDFPCIEVNFDVGSQLLNYIRYSRKPQVKLIPTRTHVGQPVSTHLASFSSRGPNSVAPAILKPDIAAPGVNILAAVLPADTPYKFESGTSMAAPHVSGIVALLKSLHPHWSPAAIKSALVTTAWVTDPHSGEPVISEGNPNKLADPFDFGGGLVNANGAKDPGLVYDMGTFDYILYLCSMGYNNSAISMLIDQAASCPIKRPSILDVNLPSLTIPSLRKTVTVRRTVTNVGPVNSKYKAIIEPPLGITIKVKPETLIFNSSTKKISFTLTISTSHKYTTYYYFGSLTWTDGVHRVRSPISVRNEFPELVC